MVAVGKRSDRNNRAVAYLSARELVDDRLIANRPSHENPGSGDGATDHIARLR